MRRLLLAASVSLLALPAVSWATTNAADAATAVHPPTPSVNRRVAVHRVNYVLFMDAAALDMTVPQLRSRWQRVAVCEVGGNWSMTGPIYSGIGFLNSTWVHYGGRRFAPVAGRATRDEQILVAMRITRTWIPDQNGCSTNGW